MLDSLIYNPIVGSYAHKLFWPVDKKIQRTTQQAFDGSVQMDATLPHNNSQHCWVLHVASLCTPYCMLLGVIALSLQLVYLLSQQLPTFLSVITDG